MGQRDKRSETLAGDSGCMARRGMNGTTAVIAAKTALFRVCAVILNPIEQRSPPRERLCEAVACAPGPGHVYGHGVGKLEWETDTGLLPFQFHRMVMENHFDRPRRTGLPGSALLAIYSHRRFILAAKREESASTRRVGRQS